jgi:hypothetical protein
MKTARKTAALVLLVIASAVISYGAPEGDSASCPMHKDRYSGCTRQGDSACPMHRGRHFGFIGVGAALLDNTKFNDRLEAAILPQFKKYASTFSLGVRGGRGRLISEHVLTGYFWKDKVRANERGSLWSAEAAGKCGFNLLKPGAAAALFPYAGLGFAFNTLRLQKDSATFSDLLAAAAPRDHALFLTQGAFLFDVGLGIDLIKSKPDKKKTMMIGIRAGYTGDIWAPKSWHSDGTTVTDLPALSHNGGYVRLVIGGMGEHGEHGRCCHRPATPAAPVPAVQQ